MNYFKKYTISLLLLFQLSIYAQLGVGTNPPDESALLDVTSTTQGFLMPRMTTAERLAIPSPTTGLFVYDTDRKYITYHDGSQWIFPENITGLPSNIIIIDFPSVFLHDTNTDARVDYPGPAVEKFDLEEDIVTIEADNSVTFNYSGLYQINLTIQQIHAPGTSFLNISNEISFINSATGEGVYGFLANPSDRNGRKNGYFVRTLSANAGDNFKLKIAKIKLPNEDNTFQDASVSIEILDIDL